MSEVLSHSESAVFTNAGTKEFEFKDSGEGNGRALQTKVFEQHDRHPSGGWLYKDEAELKRQRGVAWELLKGVGNSLLEGKDLVNTTLPIHLFEPRSFLERLTDTWAYAPRFLSAAGASVDPVERLKNVVAFAISGLHLLSTSRKPFNPIIGETYQALFPDGTEVFCEQSTHHPPASNWEVIDKNHTFHFWGYGIWSASCRGNTIKGTQKGPNNIDFADGSRVSYTLPDVNIKGVMWGERVIELGGTMVFTDETNSIACEVIFNPNAVGFVRSFFKKAKDPADTITGEIYRTTSRKRTEADTICQIEGSWLTHLDIGGKKYWDIKMVPSGVSPHPNPLPSDCRYREDLMALKVNDFEKGKEYKIMLEERQRSEEKLRKEARARSKTDHRKLIRSSR